MISLRHLRSRARGTFWLLPTLCIAASIVLAVLLPLVTVLVGDTLLFGSGPESARSFLSSITSAMITMTGLVFSITIVALQLAAGQFSSRVMRDFLGDRVIQLTFGIFVATFIYAMVLQRSVRGVTGGSDVAVPQLGMSVAFVLVLASVAMLVVYINRIANSIRVANIVDRIGTHTRGTIEARYPEQVRPPGTVTPTEPPTRYVTAERPGVIVSLNEQALVAAAAEGGSVLVLVPRIGDYVPTGARLLAQYGDRPSEDALMRHISFDTERTYEQDVAFGFRELVDIAERGLSPAVNDPTTAAQALDILHDLLRQVGQRPCPPRHHTDPDGHLRLVTDPYAFPELLDLALEEIAHYGADDVQTPRRLRALVTDLRHSVRPEYQPAVERWGQALAP